MLCSQHSTPLGRTDTLYRPTMGWVIGRSITRQIHGRQTRAGHGQGPGHLVPLVPHQSPDLWGRENPCFGVHSALVSDHQVSILAPRSERASLSSMRFLPLCPSKKVPPPATRVKGVHDDFNLGRRNHHSQTATSPCTRLRGLLIEKTTGSRIGPSNQVPIRSWTSVSLGFSKPAMRAVCCLDRS
jgi:hypothetical protein